MSAVIQRAVASPAVPRSQSVGRRPSGGGTVMAPWTPATRAGCAARSATRSARQAGPDHHVVVQERDPLGVLGRPPARVPRGGGPPALQGHDHGPVRQRRRQPDRQRVRGVRAVVGQHDLVRQRPGRRGQRVQAVLQARPSQGRDDDRVTGRVTAGTGVHRVPHGVVVADDGSARYPEPGPANGCLSWPATGTRGGCSTPIRRPGPAGRRGAGRSPRATGHSRHRDP